MTLRSYVSELQDQITRQLALHRQVVLRCVLRAHLGLEIAVQQHGPEARPILRRAGGGAEDSVKWVWIDRTRLSDEWRIQECCRQIRAATERWLCAKLLEHQLLHRVIEQAPSVTNAGFPVRPEQLPQRPFREVRTPGNTNSRGKRLVVGLCEARLNAFISRNHQ